MNEQEIVDRKIVIQVIKRHLLVYLLDMFDSCKASTDISKQRHYMSNKPTIGESIETKHTHRIHRRRRPLQLLRYLQFGKQQQSEQKQPRDTKRPMSIKHQTNYLCKLIREQQEEDKEESCPSKNKSKNKRGIWEVDDKFLLQGKAASSNRSLDNSESVIKGKF